MVRRADHPLRNVRVSYETTRFSTQHLVDAYERLVPMVRRLRRQPSRDKASLAEAKMMAAKTRRGEA